METASSLISDAFSEILVQPNEQSLESVDFQTGVRYLNRMMASWDAKGYSLGFTNINNPSDLITVPDGAMGPMVFNLAVLLAPQYDIPVSSNLILNAREGMQAVRRLTVKARPTPYPCTLPIGSGNEKNQTYSDYRYYPCPDEEILTEQEGAILLESNTDAE